MATATLNADVVFRVGDAGDDATKWKLYTAESGGMLLWAANLSNNPSPLTQNQFYRVRANQITITQAIGSDGATEEFAKRELTGALSDSTWLELFDVNNNADRSLTDRVEIPIAGWTIA